MLITATNWFHIHVYFTPSSRQHAERLRERIVSELGLQTSALIDRPVGPHPLPMFQSNFMLSNMPTVIAHLLNYRGSLDVLIHAETGDDVTDHTQNAIWLGTPVPLDIDFLRRLGR